MGVDFDTSPLYIKSDKAFFLKGVETAWTIKDGNGQNAYEIKPSESNYLYCSVVLPEGKNKVIGYYYFKEGNEGYVITYNSLGYHLIYRLRGNDGQCEIVYRFCRNFKGISNKPRFFFSEGRIEMKSLCRYKPDGTKELLKFLFLVNKQVDNIMIPVEDSIATESFTTPFFTTPDPCCGDRCRLIKSGVPTPMARINIVPITPTDADKLKQNLLFNQMLQFRFVYENAWGQRSEHGLISEQYFNNLAGCARDYSGQPHCVWLETKTPCPEIVKVTVEFRSCELRDVPGTDGNALSEWKESFHFNLYDQTNADMAWYERKYDTKSTDFEFFNDGKSIRIKFCKNRECKTIPLADIRTQNPAPINSGTVANIGKSLAYGDNENDLGTMQKEDIESIKLSLEPTEACETKYSRIKVYAVVQNWNDNQNNPIHMRGGLATFGGFGQDPAIGGIRFEEKVGGPETTLSAKGGHGQTFPEGILGFRARLAGTNYTAESVQYTYSASGLEKIGVIQTTDEAKAYVKEVGWGRHWAIQEFDFGLVPLGRYKFIINGHNDTENLENTSTYYIDTTTFGYYNQHWGVIQNSQKEIDIDTTAGNDFMSFADDAPLAVIADLTNPQNTFSIGSRVMRGYIYEGRDNKIPIELQEVTTNNGMPTGGVTSAFTDHNGFWFTAEWTSGSAFSRTNYKAQIFGTKKCAFNKIIGESGNKSAEGTTLVAPFYVGDGFPTYLTDLCNRWIVKGKISECGTGAGIEGVAVILGRTRPVYTNSKGEFKVVAHYANGRGADNLIFSLAGSCYILDCNCKPINVNINIPQPVCTVCIEKSIDVGNFNFKTIVTHGYPHGSRVQVGFIASDGVRFTDVQTTENMYINFPSEPEQQGSTYPKLIITLPDNFSADFCRRFKYLIPCYSKNVNFDDFFTWAADDVTLIDSTGEKNETNPSKIKIWWRSLNGYNILRGGNTNTKWVFLNAVTDTKGNQLLIDNQPVFNTKIGDIVEFIQTVEGKYFLPNTTGFVQYDMQGTYFLVDYDDSLKDVKPGTKFRVKRPYVCEVKKTFYEFAFPINFCGDDCRPRDDNGNIVKSFVLNGYSSYMLPRQIPVVKDVETVVETTGGSSESALKNIIVTPIVNKVLGWNQNTSYTIKDIKTTEVKKNTSYPFTFEHHSPSDTWGDHCSNGGRISFINPYEKKRCDRTQILITGGLNQANDGAVNYLHYFSLEEEFVLDEDGFGAITAILVRNDQQVLVICDFRIFSFRFNENRVIVTEQGYLSVPTNKRFSKPEANPYFEFGCQPNDINTIRRRDSVVSFLDSHKQAIVEHDFTNAFDISAGIQSWLVPSIKEVNANPDTKYWHLCFDFRLKKLLLTKFDLTTDQYGNAELDKNILLNETVAYNFESKEWGQVHFTPEYFGYMFAETKDTQFFSFKNGLPYAHHNSVNPGKVYLNYFGIQYFPAIGIVTNEGGSQEKSFIGTQVYCREQKFILQKLETSMGQESHVFEGAWETGAGMSYAPYLCDIKNIDACNKTIQDPLFDGDTLYGKWLKGLYIPKPGYDGRFFLISLIISTYENRFSG